MGDDHRFRFAQAPADHPPEGAGHGGRTDEYEIKGPDVNPRLNGGGQDPTLPAPEALPKIYDPK